MPHLQIRLQDNSRLTSRSSGGHPLTGVRRLLLLSIAVAACESAPPRVRQLAPALTPELGSLQLFPDSGQPLEAQSISAVSRTGFVAFDPGLREVWMFSFAGTPSMRRLAKLDIPRATTVLGISYGPSGVGVLDSRGRVTVLDTLTGRPVDTVRMEARGNRHVLGIQGLSDGSWAVMEEQMTVDPNTGAMLDSLVLYQIFNDSRSEVLWRQSKFGNASFATLLTDYVSFSGTGDTLHIAAAAPPRIWEFIVGRDTAARSIAQLQGAPERAISRQEIEEVRRLTRRPGLADIQLPTVYPPLARAWPVSNGFAVLAGAGGKNFVLDQYCGSRFSRTALNAPDIADITWLPTVVVVRRQGVDASYFRLDFYAPSQLAIPCPVT